MKLIIKRDQAQQKGMFGGSKGVLFSLSCRAQFTDAERALIDRYQMDTATLATYHFEGMEHELPLTVGRLANGFTNSIGDLGELIKLEETIVDSCKTLHGYLKVAATFGGEEVVEIGDDEPEAAPPPLPAGHR